MGARPGGEGDPGDGPQWIRGSSASGRSWPPAGAARRCVLLQRVSRDKAGTAWAARRAGLGLRMRTGSRVGRREGLGGGREGLAGAASGAARRVEGLCGAAARGLRRAGSYVGAAARRVERRRLGGGAQGEGLGGGMRWDRVRRGFWAGFVIWARFFFG